jgi:hypothetical protein
MSTAPGITRKECSTDCNAARCVISRRPFCLHPCKMAFPESLSHDEEAKRAYDAARESLGMKPMFKIGAITS